MIHVFHGFLGSPQDFTFLATTRDVILHDLTTSELDSLEVGQDDTLIGYSMGGRIALELAAKFNFNLKRLVLINAHPGLATASERQSRETWENEVQDRMLQKDFISYWNSLPVFAHDNPLNEMPLTHLMAAKELFKKFRLSKQKNFLPELKRHKEKVMWFIGSKDEKYRVMAETQLAPLKIPFRLIEGGHRLIQNPEGLKKVLTEEGIL